MPIHTSVQLGPRQGGLELRGEAEALDLPRALLRLFVLLVAGTAFSPPGFAQTAPGDLLITPTRIVFEGRQRTGEITLVNTGTASATYRISFVRRRMTEEGGTKPIGEKDVLEGERFADDLIRYSPRQVTLEPRVAQTVRLQLRKPDGLQAGEYRSHLLFRAVPVTGAEEKGGAAAALSVQLTAIYGISIPIIVRQGETSARTTLSGLAVVAGETAASLPLFRFRIEREGSQSIYGNLTATFTPLGGKPLVVGVANGVAVYTPNTTRSGALSLRVPPGVVLRQGSLRLTYSRVDKGHAPLAEAEIRLP